MRSPWLSTDLRNLLLPRACVACGEGIPPEVPRGLICARCLSRLHPPSPPFCPRCQAPLGTGFPRGEICVECARWPATLVSARTATVLSDVSMALVHALKYGGWGGLAGPMAEMMSREMPEGLRDAFFVPVPTTPWRSRIRGYNQAALLARALTSIAGLPTVEAVEREGGRTQVRLGPRERRRNVLGAFVLRENIRSQIRNRDVIVVDDVLTTGATASSVALVLRAGGASSVKLLAFARALPFREGSLA